MAARPRFRLDWIPRHSIVGRIVHPLFEERRTLAGRMSWIGLALLAVFLVVAVAAGAIAPYDPILPVDEKNVPPWAEVEVPRNETFTAWSGSWAVILAAQVPDGIGSKSIAVNETEDLYSFALEIRRDVILSVGVDVRMLGVGTNPGHYLLIQVSRNGGTTWDPAIEVRAVDSYVHIDLSAVAVWKAADLTRTALMLRLIHASDGGAPGSLTVDYIGVTATWRSYWHLMGTDAIGRDVFSRVLHGTRTSLAIMAIAVSVAFLVGFPLGLYSGYRGGPFDKTIVLVMDSLYAFPGLLFAGLIAVLLGKGVVNIGLAITVIYIPLYFRVTRSQVLSAREALYVEAARALGVSRRHIVFRYIATNVIIAVPVIFSISAADAILTAAGLSYLGLGLEGDIPDWGLDLSAGAERIDNGIWWSSFFPGLAIVILTIGLSFLGEGLNDIINPLLKKERS